MSRALLALTVLVAIAPRVARADDRAAAGVVVSAANDPLPNAKVTLFDSKGIELGSTTTDVVGRWKLVVKSNDVLTARVEVIGLPPASTLVRPDQVLVRTEMKAPGSGGTDLEVSGEKPPPPPPPSTPTRYTLEAGLMTKLPGTRGDPFSAVTSLPSMGRPPALSTVYIVRGAGPEETAMFIDGAPMPHAFHFGGLVGVVPAPLVRSISIAPGGFGSPFGRATAGIVDVLLASPLADGVHGSLVLDAIDVGATLTAPLIKGKHETTIAIGARRSHVDAWIGTLLGDTVAGDLPRYIDGQVVVEHAFTPRARLRTAFLASDDSVSITDPSSPADRARTGTWKAHMLRLHSRFEAGYGSKGAVLAVASLGTSTDSILGETDFWSTTRKQAYARLEGTVPIDTPERVRLTIGADALLTRLEGDRILGMPASSFGGSSIFQLRGAINVDRAEPGAYAQLQFEPIKGLLITPGVRFDRSPHGEALFQPRLAIRGEVAQTTVLKAVTGLYTRSNTFDAVDARDYQGTLIPAVLDPPPVRGAQAGVGIEQGIARDVFFLVDLWTRATSGVLLPVQQPARPMYDELLNGDRVVSGYYYPLHTEEGRTRAMGLEMLLKFSSPTYAGFLGYSLSRAEVRDGPHTAWRRAPFDQTHILNAVLIVKLGKGWEAGGRFRLAKGVLDSPYPATEIAPKNDPNLDPNRPLPELQPIHSLDLRLEKSFNIGSAAAIAAYAEVRNVYDRRVREPLAYNHVYGYPVVGPGLPIIPNLGVRGSF